MSRCSSARERARVASVWLSIPPHDVAEDKLNAEFAEHCPLEVDLAIQAERRRAWAAWPGMSDFPRSCATAPGRG